MGKLDGKVTGEHASPTLGSAPAPDGRAARVPRRARVRRVAPLPPDPLGTETRPPRLSTTYTIRREQPSWDTGRNSGEHGVIPTATFAPEGPQEAPGIYPVAPLRRHVPEGWDADLMRE